MAGGKRGQKGFKGQRGKRGQRGPQEVRTKPESSLWSPLVESNDTISRGRVRGTHPEYSVAQTMRYKSQWERYQKALALAAIGPFAVVGSTYYWEASRKPRPESVPFSGKEDWWPEKPPLKRQADPYEQQYPNYNNPYGDYDPVIPDEPGQSPDLPLPPDLPPVPPGVDVPDDPGTSLPSPDGSLPEGYSTSPDGFWKVTTGGGDTGWQITGDGWTETGEDSFTNDSGTGGGSFTIEDGSATGGGGVAPPRPFTGGQCVDGIYRVTGVAHWKDANTGENKSSAEPINVELQGPIYGDGLEVRDSIFFPGTQDGNGYVYYKFGKQNLGGFGFARPGSASHTTTITRIDGQPDNCGDPPHIYVP
jgi:hypothetical protein